MFKKMLQAVGVGGPSVDTVLSEEPSRPGGHLIGEVRIGGASGEADIQKIVLSLIAEVETDDEEKQGLEFQQVVAAEDFRLEAEEHRTIPFTIPVPWEAPITAVHGRPLRGMRLGVSTQVAVAKAVDTSDMDPVRVEPLASQQPVIDALLAMGAHVKSADLEHGHIHGVHQEFPFYQEIEFFPPPQFAGQVGEIELTFISRPDSVDVVLEADKRGDLFTPGGDAFGRIHRGHEEALATDWEAEITQWLQAVAEHSGGHMVHGHHEHRQHGSSPGMGGMLAAGAGGLATGAVGGMVLGEMLDEGVDEEEIAEDVAEEMEDEG
ncbi:sporulation-control protein [Halopolyspora algeriensis]|uniref:Sporulation-control protein n=1 Tax=Halopolyspora algeriensis TaxID=1500506 RepID=A0A368VF35_9ACTN|nr:sporulation-control protein [Halopolyspora algeriensis]TQM56401.1 sporulation-control protein [Halopolyspora algeriensis]